jgi:excinuclease UvrABC helicase subunit UvrB
MDYFNVPLLEEEREYSYSDKNDLIIQLEKEMINEAKKLNFEKAAILRDKIEEIRMMGVKKSKKRKEYKLKI